MGVVPIVNENDTISVSVRASLESVWGEAGYSGLP